MEKVQLILQLLHPYTFIPTSTVIREMRVQTFQEYALVCLGLCTVHPNFHGPILRHVQTFQEYELASRGIFFFRDIELKNLT